MSASVEGWQNNCRLWH